MGPRPAGIWEISEASLAFGGVAAKTVSAPRAEAAIRGRPLSQETLAAGLAALAEDILISPSAPGKPVVLELSGAGRLHYFHDLAVRGRKPRQHRLWQGPVAPGFLLIIELLVGFWRFEAELKKLYRPLDGMMEYRRSLPASPES